ncbi:MAG: hypothetical protein SGARI_006995 [Bacillariaceae sp.]
MRLDTPNRHRTLIHSLNLELKWGERLLIIGASGIGKSSLLRAIAGLWTSGSGVIERANIEDVYFLPQKPYCPLGTLKDQLLYPATSECDKEGSPAQKKAIDTKRLLEILRAVDLGDLAARAGEGDELAVHEPKLVIVDEATSAMDVAAEEKMYRLIQNMTVVSVGHRPTLLGYHTRRLHLKKTIGKDYCECSMDDIRSTPQSVNNDEVNLFFR